MICFLSGGHGPGGAQSIQLRLFKSLIAKGEQCKLFDLIDGWVYKTFIDTNLPFEFVEIQFRDKNDYSEHLDQEDLLIVFDGNLFGNMLLFPKSECKVLVWEIYYPWVERFIYTRYFPIKWLALKQEIKILDLIVKNNAFYFIDIMGKELVEKRLNVEIEESKYLPIPIDDLDIDCTNQNLNEKITLSYVGRSVIWKINPMVKVLSDLIESNLGNQIEVNIVCDDAGAFNKKLVQHVCVDGLSITYYENLNSKQLSELLQKSDVHISMGTAALDGAKLGIPTILIDGSYDLFPPGYKYRWIYETKHLNLGRIINSKSSEFDGNYYLRDMIESLRENKKIIANECRNYVFNNYHVDIVVDRVIEGKRTTKLKMSMFSRFCVYRYFKLLRKFGFK